jgi:hypothetical protein
VHCHSVAAKRVQAKSTKFAHTHNHQPAFHHSTRTSDTRRNTIVLTITKNNTNTNPTTIKITMFARTGMFAASRMAARQAAPRAVTLAPRGVRSFGSHAPREYEGLEAHVRKVLPEDHQIVLATIGMWFSFYLVVKLTGSSAEAVEEAPAAAPVADKSGEEVVPALFSDEFEAFSKIPGNMEKWEASVAEW